jgi:multimeric flavodoxin WrbA
MRILALNSSPRSSGQSRTELMLTYLVKGMRDANANVETVNLRENIINNCVGCFTCWTKSPGKCIHKDDMTNNLFPKWLESDIVVYATPLYCHFMNGAMSTFRERTLPAVQPFFEIKDQRTSHPLRQKLPASVWLSVCGFPEESEFDMLSEYLNRTRNKDIMLLDEIYRPAAEILTNPLFKKKATDILNATEQAGRELVQFMKISPESMRRIKQSIINSESMAKITNEFWKTCIEEKVTPKEFQEKRMVPRIDSLENFMLLLPFGLNIKAVGNNRFILQFKFSGVVEGSCYFTIDKGNIYSKMGVSAHPDLTIETPFALWIDIMNDKLDGQRMFMEQAYKVTGDISLMIQLFQKEV